MRLRLRWDRAVQLLPVAAGLASVLFYGCTKPDSGPTEAPTDSGKSASVAQQAPPDTKIAEAVKAKFAATPELKDEKITVDVKDAGVILTGTVSSDAVRIKAEDTARDVPDVYRVDAEKLVAK